MKTAIGPIVALLLVVGCGAPSPSASAAAAASETLDPGLCALATPPGPNDKAPQAGGDIDHIDLGGGRWRVCVDEPTALAVEGTAWCRWNDNRTVVNEVQGVPVAIRGTTVDGGIALDRQAIYLSTTSADGAVSSYEARTSRRTWTPQMPGDRAQPDSHWAPFSTPSIRRPSGRRV